MTNLIKQKYTAHPIGQGLFYTGQLKSRLPNAEFNFVFDCGSLSYSALNKTIDRFRAIDSNDSKKLDLLVISHFDMDHINGLKRLLDGRKVKCIIAPFIGFKQRISIALNNLDEFDTDQDLRNDINAVLDITDVLAENIDGDTEIIFVNGSDEGQPPNEEGNEDIENLNEEINEFTFEFSDAKELSTEDTSELNLPNIANVKKVDCNNLATIHGNRTKILDLIFYRKKVGANETAFFNKVFDIFISNNETDFQDKTNPTIDEIIEVIKKTKSANKIKPLFNEAAKQIGVDLTKKSISNMNTTALSMLHWDKISSGHFRKKQATSKDIFFEREMVLSKVYGYKVLNIPFSNIHRHNFYHYDNLGIYYSANTLLTADSFLKEKNDVDTFIKYYQFYLAHLLMFQVPHHGSKHSSDKYLLAQIPKSHCFINYGVNHNFIKSWSHPAKEVINDLVATGHASELIPVHEYAGYQIVQKIHIMK